MLRCMKLGSNALGSAAPNPMVGSVIVHEDKIIGEGYTSPYGGPHAEVNAVVAVADKALLKESTLYVSLEPCSHYGQTPPCTDMIINYQIPRVVIGLVDPNKKVNGSGIKKLKESGCEVITGILEKECREHHKRFLTYHEKQRPYIILKWAETQDGYIAPAPHKRQGPEVPFWISGVSSRQLVHQWRSQEQAILAGTTTILQDNPVLTTRYHSGKSPVRVVPDRDLRIPENWHVMDGGAETLVLTEVSDSSKYRGGISYNLIDFSDEFPSQVLESLYRRQLTSLIVEGGLQTLTSFIKSGLWDEARVFIAVQTLGEGIRAPDISGRMTFRGNVGEDQLHIFRND
jgi:diaminohydroxyphosphoribosylaminopyrimidine deaminase / 5-amino-6-(5-phosphoribosylamino)uracil reductase